VNRRLWTATAAAVFVATLLLWSWLLRQHFSPWVTALAIVGPVVLVFPTVLAGRRILDAAPTPERAVKVTTVVHGAVMLLFGVATVTAVHSAGGWRGINLPVPHVVAALLCCATGAAALLSVLTLALRGFGAPFAIALSERLATDWLYSRSRNPMVLTTLACLFAAGLWLQSALFLVWHLALVTPALLFFVRVFEERELEIRFGEAYRLYRAATPFLWPSARPHTPPDVGSEAQR